VAKSDQADHPQETIDAAWVIERPKLNSTVTLADYDPEWPRLFEHEAERIRGVLGERAVRIEHVGSTSVPGLCAKPIIDIMLLVPDSADEPAYVPELEAAGYVLNIREPDWEQHRYFKGPDTNINLHVYSPSTTQVERYMLFRDRLRSHGSERDLYAVTKRELAARKWEYIQDYSDAKNEVIDEIIERAKAGSQYDDFSEVYAHHTAKNPYNALYDRPAILELAGEVGGERVLDVGCAAGHLSVALAGRGAEVTGVDLSQGMVDVARRLSGGKAEFRWADITEPLAFETGTFDLITASLVLHYFEDWAPTLAEFRRVLRPGGRLVFSVHHPEDWHWFGLTDYFPTERVVDEWEMGDRTQEVAFYRRPLSRTFSALRQAGFAVDEIAEPQPLPECEAAFPDAFKSLSTKPRFLFFRAISPA
jgi:GrpB-like predicted nucleotidyltransferase (UPF0157 family)/trans-aconitate methyltransferase